MKTLFFILLVGFTFNAQAVCRQFKPDGSVVKCTPAAIYDEPDSKEITQGICAISVKLAYDSYLRGTPDAKYPSLNYLHYLVDYFGDMLDVKHVPAISQKSVEVIAIRMQATGMRKPWVGAVNEIAQEIIVKECLK